jgi:hypothetical protein
VVSPACTRRCAPPGWHRPKRCGRCEHAGAGASRNAPAHGVQPPVGGGGSVRGAVRVREGLGGRREHAGAEVLQQGLRFAAHEDAGAEPRRQPAERPEGQAVLDVDRQPGEAGPADRLDLLGEPAPGPQRGGAGEGEVILGDGLDDHPRGVDELTADAARLLERLAHLDESLLCLVPLGHLGDARRERLEEADVGHHVPDHVGRTLDDQRGRDGRHGRYLPHRPPVRSAFGGVRAGGIGHIAACGKRRTTVQVEASMVSIRGYTGVRIYILRVTKHLVDIDDVTLGAARAELGTTTLKDTVNEALRLVASSRDERVAQALDTLAAADLEDRADAWR